MSYLSDKPIPSKLEEQFAQETTTSVMMRYAQASSLAQQREDPLPTQTSNIISHPPAIKIEGVEGPAFCPLDPVSVPEGPHPSLRSPSNFYKYPALAPRDIVDYTHPSEKEDPFLSAPTSPTLSLKDSTERLEEILKGLDQNTDSKITSKISKDLKKNKDTRKTLKSPKKDKNGKLTENPKKKKILTSLPLNPTNTQIANVLATKFGAQGPGKVVKTPAVIPASTISNILYSYPETPRGSQSTDEIDTGKKPHPSKTPSGLEQKSATLTITGDIKLTPLKSEHLDHLQKYMIDHKGIIYSLLPDYKLKMSDPEKNVIKSQIRDLSHGMSQKSKEMLMAEVDLGHESFDYWRGFIACHKRNYTQVLQDELDRQRSSRRDEETATRKQIHGLVEVKEGLIQGCDKVAECFENQSKTLQAAISDLQVQITQLKKDTAPPPPPSRSTSTASMITQDEEEIEAFVGMLKDPGVFSSTQAAEVIKALEIPTEKVKQLKKALGTKLLKCILWHCYMFSMTLTDGYRMVKEKYHHYSFLYSQIASEDQLAILLGIQ